MRKYLELFTDGFDATVAEKTKVENWPYVGYSPSEGVVFTVIPAPVEGPADNEIWYTSSDGNVVDPYYTNVLGTNIVSNTYENGKGIITFDGPVTSIGEMAFQYCSSLTSVTIGNSVTSIGRLAFEGCSSLTSITIPNSVTSIGSGAFHKCSSLTSITIPNSVKIIGWDVFRDTEFYNNPSNWTNGTLYINDCLIKVDTNLVGDFTIEPDTRVIAGGAFCECSSLNSVTIPNSVTSIGDWAFDSCSSLTSITIPNSVTSIGYEAFRGCSSLTSIEFQGNMEQWNAISKGSNWNYNVLATHVQCTDGQVTL